MATENLKYLDSQIMQELISNLKTRLGQKIDKNSGVYQAGGSYSFANLPAAGASNVGLVYNITDDFTTTADFIEGAGVEVGPGTDVAVVMTSVDPPAYGYNLFGRSEEVEDITHEEYEEMWKDPGVLELSGDDVLINAINGTATVTVTSASGVVTAESSDTDIATVSVSGTTITITAVDFGSATITVTSASSATNRKVSKNIALLVMEPLAGGDTAIQGPYNAFLSNMRSFRLDVKYIDRYQKEQLYRYEHIKGDNTAFGFMASVLSDSDIYFIFTNLEDSTPFSVSVSVHYSAHTELGSGSPVTVKFVTPDNSNSEQLGLIKITVKEDVAGSPTIEIQAKNALYQTKSSNSDFSIVSE